MADRPTYPCGICEEPITDACSHERLLVCRICGAPAKRDETGVFRHAGHGFTGPIPAHVPSRTAAPSDDGDTHG